jgi:hypothetical protein
MRPLAAGEDAHRGGPAVQVVPGGAVAQQPGQLGDMGFLDPAAAVRAAAISAGVIGAALAHLAMVIDGDLPGLPGNLSDRGALAFTQFPPDRVDELVARPGCQLIQALDQPVAGPGAVTGHHQPPPELRWQRGERRRQDLQVVGGGVGPGAARPQRGGQRLSGVVTPAAQRVQAFSEQCQSSCKVGM